MVVVVTADFNLDGKPDVAFATASVLRVYPGKGDGTSRIEPRRTFCADSG